MRAQLRRGWTSIFALVLLVGLAGGAVMATMAAARRTDSAFDRMVEVNHTSDAIVNPDQGIDSQLTMKMVRSLPAVSRAARIDFAQLLPAGKVRTMEQMETLPPFAIPSDGVGYRTDRRVVDAGRMPDPKRADEVFVERWYAKQQHLRVGSHFDMRALTGTEAAAILQNQDEDPDFPATDALGVPVRFTVTGIGGSPESVAFDQGYEPLPIMGTAAFWKKFHEPSASFWGTEVDLKPGATAEQLRRQIDGLNLTYLDDGVQKKEAFAVQTLASTRQQVVRAVGPQVAALWVFAAIAAFVASDGGRPGRVEAPRRRRRRQPIARCHGHVTP